jgi:hypothetical protein
MGFRFVQGGAAAVRFACVKGFMEAPGTIVDDETLTFETPNFGTYVCCMSQS